MKRYSATLMLWTTVLLSSSCISQNRMVRNDSLIDRRPAARFQPLGDYADPQYFSYDPDANFSCQEIFYTLLLSNPEPKTVDAALKVLSAKKPKFFTHYSIMSNSLSLQSSSYSYPRAVVYGGNGETVLTFNGNPKDAGYEAIELMCFHEESATFEFREIAFPAQANQNVDYLTTAQQVRNIVFSPPNGFAGTTHDCRQCHQTPARPNWDAYAKWPSAYGAEDDELTRVGFFNDTTGSVPHQFDFQYTRAEQYAQRSFVRTGRYANLGVNNQERPNLTLGKLLGRLNAKRIVAELARQPKFDAKKFARVMYCPLNLSSKDFAAGNTLSTFSILRPPFSPELHKVIRDIASYQSTVQARLIANFKLMNVSAPRDSDIYSDYNFGPALSSYYQSIGLPKDEADGMILVEASEATRISNMVKLVAPLGIDVQNWSLIANGGYEFEDGSGGDAGVSFIQQLDEPFLNTFFASDAKLMNLVTARRSGIETKTDKEFASDDRAICDYLSK